MTDAVIERVARAIADFELGEPAPVRGTRLVWATEIAKAALAALKPGDNLGGELRALVDYNEAVDDAALDSATRAAAAEREACALEAESWRLETAGGSDAGLVIAQAIRGRKS